MTPDNLSTDQPPKLLASPENSAVSSADKPKSKPPAGYAPLRDPLESPGGWRSSELHAAVAAAVWIIQITESGLLPPIWGASFITVIVLAYVILRAIVRLTTPPGLRTPYN